MTSLSTSFVKIARINPYHFHKFGSGDFFYNQIPDFEKKIGYRQLAHWGGNIYFQFMCLNSALTIGGSTGAYCRIVDNNGLTKHTLKIQRLQDLYTLDGYTVYAVTGNWPLADAGLADGTYFFKLTIPSSSGSYWIFYSEPFKVAESHDNSVVIEYDNDENDYDVIWTDVLSQKMFIEVEGGVKSDDVTPGGKFTMYMDLGQRPTSLNNTPYNTYKFTFGDAYGLPNWMADKLNRALCCSEIYIDNIGYSRAENAKMERSGEENFPLSAWTIDLIRSDGDSSIDYTESGQSDTGAWNDDGVWQDTETMGSAVAFEAAPVAFDIYYYDQTLTVTIASDATWTATSNNAGATPTASGKDNEPCYIGVAENNETDGEGNYIPRTITVSIVVDGWGTQEIIINQEAKPIK